MERNIKSIRYPLAIDSGLGTLAEENRYSAHVVQLMKQVLFTAPGERINRPEFGCGIKRMVFAPNSEASANLAQIAILQALEKWLASVLVVEEVQVKALEEKLDIRIAYRLIALPQRRFLNLEVSV